MAAFYHCSECGTEFLSHDHIPDDDEILIVCDRCGHVCICGICGDPFHPTTVHVAIDGAIFIGDSDYCPTCDALEKTPPDEQVALAAGE